MGFLLGIPPTILNLIQAGVIERAFHDSLFPELLFRQEATFEEWDTNSGTELYMTRPGLLTPSLTPLVPGTDPTPDSLTWEQWKIILLRWGGTMDTDMQNNAVAAANIFYRNIQQQGLQAGQTLNRIPRNTLFKAYLQGQTALIDAVGAPATSLHVGSINGFTEVIIPGTNVRPEAVSATRPLPITIYAAAGALTNTIIGAIPDGADLSGPGTLLLGAAVGGAGALARAPVVSGYAPFIIRAGGGYSIDAIGTADTFVMQHMIVAAALLRNNNVPPHEDGTYHAHIGPLVQAQAFTDTALQRLFTSQPDSEQMRTGKLGTIGNVSIMLNSESPQTNNCGTRTLTGTNAYYATEIGAEVTNDSGIDIGRVIVTGKGALYERGLDEKAYITEAGVTGKIGDFETVNAGISVVTDRIKLYIRAPLNRTADKVSTTWTCSTGFACPSDIGAPSSSALFKRAVCIECAV